MFTRVQSPDCLVCQVNLTQSVNSLVGEVFAGVLTKQTPHTLKFIVVSMAIHKIKIIDNYKKYYEIINKLTENNEYS